MVSRFSWFSWFSRFSRFSRFSWFSWFLLLMALSCCVCGLELNVAHRSYQAEEKQNVTLDWTFRPKPDPSLKRLFVFCDVFTINRKNPVLFYLSDGVEIPLKDEEFSGRVQCDKDVLKEGRIRLHVSSLRTEDSGRYWCEVKSEYEVKLDRCDLNVTAARTQTHSETGPEEPDSGGQGRIYRYHALGLTVSVVLIVFCVSITLYFQNKLNIKSKETDSDESSAQGLKTSALCSQNVSDSVSEAPSENFYFNYFRENNKHCCSKQTNLKDEFNNKEIIVSLCDLKSVSGENMKV